MRDSLPLYSTDAVRAIDSAAIAGGIPGYVLMSRAAQAALDALRVRWPKAQRMLVACGSGNNGGDGYVLARLARQSGMQVDVVALPGRSPRSDDAQQALRDWRDSGGSVQHFETGAALPQADVVVDALLGIGLTRAPDASMKALIEAINAAAFPVLALDVPSGVDAQTGAIPDVAVHAELTVTFIAAKQGLLTGPALDAVGDIRLADLGVSTRDVDASMPTAFAIDARGLVGLPKRRPNGHKGNHGHVLAVGGDHGAGGALRLCVEASLRGGAGLVTALTRPEHIAPLLAARAECMAIGSESGAVPAVTQRATVIALGPGLGQVTWGRKLYAALRDDNRPAVWDADALNLLAADPRQVPGRILTPHPGEAGRLLGSSAAQVQQDRFAALAALVDRYAATVVLKGAGTLVGSPRQRPMVIRAGNPGMGSGGMGDLLTGLIAALLAQGVAPFEAAWLGALLHAVAGDCAAAEGGQRGMLASDLLPWLRGDRAQSSTREPSKGPR